MWKYQCKRQLLYILLGAIAGAVIFGVVGYQKEVILSMAGEFIQDKEALQDPYLLYVFGAIFVAGIVNGLSLFFYVVQRFNLSFLVILLILMLGGDTLALTIGIISLPICIIVYLYGWLTIPNRSKRKNLENSTLSTVQEVERVYRLHHHYEASYEEMAKTTWKNLFRFDMICCAGLFVLLLVLMYVQDFFLVLIGMLLYMFLFLQVTKYKNQLLQPIVALLYEQCDPEGCASAIFALAKRSRRKKRFPLSQQLAQCMIYLDDPHLAIDVLAAGNMQGRNDLQYAYHSLMAYAYYQLGDRSMVQHHLEACQKNTRTVGMNMNAAMHVMRTQTLEAIENKLHLMDQKFSEAEKFYQGLLQGAMFMFQKVDAQYYLGLIAFVRQDLNVAYRYFRFVTEHGNKMFFVEKARQFLHTIDAMEQAEATQQ